MAVAIEEIRNKARARFLGRDHVIGIGLMENDEQNLAILLQRESPVARAEITHWAKQHEIQVEFLVAGDGRPDY